MRCVVIVKSNQRFGNAKVRLLRLDNSIEVAVVEWTACLPRLPGRHDVVALGGIHVGSRAHVQGGGGTMSGGQWTWWIGVPDRKARRMTRLRVRHKARELEGGTPTVGSRLASDGQMQSRQVIVKIRDHRAWCIQGRWSLVDGFSTNICIIQGRRFSAARRSQTPTIRPSHPCMR